MIDISSYDWSTGTPADHQNVARHATPQQLSSVARSYDWRLYPEEVLGWIMAQKCIDLGSALTAFLNGEPERFNYMPKRDVPEMHRAAARVLDNICLRVNCGFYLCHAALGVENETRLARWLKYQAIDRSEGRRGRWILDERICDALHEKVDLPDTVALPDNSKKSLLHDVLSPIAELGVSREHLKYLPSDS
ncbi:MAG: hypothetical protein AB8B82_08665 [Roseovarius sp.]